MQHLVIRLTDLMVETLNDSINAFAFTDRKGKPSMETDSRRYRSPAEIGIRDNVRNPEGLARLPDTLDELHTLVNVLIPAVFDDLGCVNLRAMPQINKTQHPSFLIHLPEHAQWPVQTFADASQNGRNGLLQGGRLCQHQGHGILSHEGRFRAPGLSEGMSKSDDFVHGSLPSPS
jgi:hypothetical protein